MRKQALIFVGLALILTACGEPKLRDLRPPSDGPDEFRIVPYLPLEEPESYSDLPTPATTGPNRVDPRPLSDVANALGGQKGSENAPVPAVDAGLVSYASRGGVDPNIRASLAKEDEEFRKRRARFTQIRLFPEDRYRQVYDRQLLKPQRVADQYRRAGVPVPAAPPRNRRR